MQFPEGLENTPFTFFENEIAPQFCPSYFLRCIGFVTLNYSLPSQVCLQQSLSCATACAQSIFFCCKISDFDTSLSILTRNKSIHGFWISAVKKKVFIFLFGKYIKVVNKIGRKVSKNILLTCPNNEIFFSFSQYVLRGESWAGQAK